MTKQRSVSHSRLVKALDRHPAMPALLESLPPRAAAVMFQRIGITDATELMAMVPAQSLLRTFDESIWKSARPGERAAVDVKELLEWLEAWNEIGETFLLERLAVMSDDYLVLVLSCLLQVDSETEYPEYGDVFDAFIEERPGDAERFGPYDVLIAVEERDVVRATLYALWIEEPERMLRILGRLSHLHGTPDATRGWTTTALDVEFERQSFREAHGYVSVEGARAFLSMADSMTAQQILGMSEYDAETQRHLRRIAEAPRAENPVIGDVVDAMEADDSEDASSAVAQAVNAEESLAALRSLLENADLLEPVSPQRLLTGTRVTDEPQLATQLRLLAGEDFPSFQARTRELAYLANVLKVTNTVQGVALTDHEAKDAAFALCNLGVELASFADTLYLCREPGLIRPFMFAWRALRTLPERVVKAFECACAQPGQRQSWLSDEIATGLGDLVSAVTVRNWSDARDAIVFLQIAFDTASCHAILPLLDDIPRYSRLLDAGKRIDEARWIASKADLDRLGQLLAGISLK